MTNNIRRTFLAGLAVFPAAIRAAISGPSGSTSTSTAAPTLPPATAAAPRAAELRLTHFIERAEESLPNTPGSPSDKGQQLARIAAVFGEDSPEFREIFLNMKHADAMLAHRWDDLRHDLSALARFVEKAVQIQNRDQLHVVEATAKATREAPELYLDFLQKRDRIERIYALDLYRENHAQQQRIDREYREHELYKEHERLLEDVTRLGSENHDLRLRLGLDPYDRISIQPIKEA
jgi:hypothetical protein